MRLTGKRSIFRTAGNAATLTNNQVQIDKGFRRRFNLLRRYVSSAIRVNNKFEDGHRSEPSHVRIRRAALRACGRAERLVELLLGSGANFVEFRVQPSDFGIQFDEAQALRRGQPSRFHPSVVLACVCFNGDAGGRLHGSRVALQVDQIEA